MVMDDKWPTCTCGAELPRIDVSTPCDRVPQYVPGKPCHTPPPTPEQLRAQADREWLAYHRRLATEGY